MSTQETESDIHSTEHNDNIHVAVTKKPHCQVKFDIKITPKAVDAAYYKALKSVNKEISVPGFRKGRAPDNMVLERYGDVVQKEFIDLVLQTGFNEAIQLTHIHPLKDGTVKRPFVHECSREKGAHFTIEFESRPILPTIKLNELEIKKAARPQVTDDERKNALQNVLLQFATYDPINDRAVQENDFVEVSVSLLGEEPREVIQKQRTQVNATGLPSWLRQKVIGLQAGESAEGMTEQDSALIETDPNFVSVPFRVTVHSISQGNLPAVDDELAKRVGLQTVEELTQKIDERLNQEVEDQAFKEEIHAIEKALIEHYPIDLPQSYIDSNKEARLNHYLEQLEKQKKSYSEADQQQIEQSIEQSTIFNLQLFFLLRKIATDHHITVNADDITQELTHQIALMSSGRNNIDFSNKNDVQEQLQNLALDRKIKQYLVSQVTFKD